LVVEALIRKGTTMRHALVGSLLLAFIWPATAQEKLQQDGNPRFEVASIKPCRPQDSPPTPDEFLRILEVKPPSGNRYYQTCITIPQLVTFAFDMPRRRLRFPEWTSLEFFEVDARTADQVDIGVMRLMVRQLLADRFAFLGHTEAIALDAYKLVLARPDGQLGPNARPAAIDCAPEVPRDEKAKAYCALGGGSSEDGVSTRRYVGTRMSRFAQSLPRLPGRKVQDYDIVDETGLDGIYDLTLSWDVYEFGEANGRVGARSDAALNAALEAQPGLRLVHGEGQVEFLVIDRVEFPTPN
jgi:uncharacterized protein (TIGR03435 family)